MAVVQCFSSIPCMRDTLSQVVVFVGIAAGLVLCRRHSPFSRIALLGVLGLVLYAAADAALPVWLRLAHRYPDEPARAGPVSWRTQEPGLELGDLDVMLFDTTVDHVSLIRVDPARFRFVVRHDARHPVPADEWRRRLNAVAVVNGSYYTVTGSPETPIRTHGESRGPLAYTSGHGAFLADPAPSFVRFQGADPWPSLVGARDAMVSYPLLVAPSGAVAVARNPKWLANRNFVAHTRGGSIVLGTTATGFFSLRRLADFLASAPLEIDWALNLDGGPVAEQSVIDGASTRELRGRWELTDRSNTVTELWDLVRTHSEFWKLPIVLAVVRR